MALSLRGVLGRYPYRVSDNADPAMIAVDSDGPTPAAVVQPVSSAPSDQSTSELERVILSMDSLDSLHVMHHLEVFQEAHQVLSGALEVQPGVGG
jgi:hypothetical protein